jgi:hypothetical protein
MPSSRAEPPLLRPNPLSHHLDAGRPYFDRILLCSSLNRATVWPCRLYAPSHPCHAYTDSTALLYLAGAAALLPVSTQTQGGALPTYPSILPLFCTETSHRAIVFHCCRDDATLTVPIAGSHYMFRSSCSPSCVRPSSREFTLQESNDPAVLMLGLAEPSWTAVATSWPTTTISGQLQTPLTCHNIPSSPMQQGQLHSNLVDAIHDVGELALTY